MSLDERTRVSDAATRIQQGFDASRTWVIYDLGGWIVRLECDPGAPFDGPGEVRIYLNMGEDDDDSVDAIELAQASGGITAEVLRSVPLGDARKVLRRLRSEFISRRDSESYDLPVRMKSLEDWARFARAYARSAASNPNQPLPHLARATGLSPNTLAARLRRVQELGLLAPSGESGASTTWLVMTERALGILKGEGSG